MAKLKYKTHFNYLWLDEDDLTALIKHVLLKLTICTKQIYKKKGNSSGFSGLTKD